MDIWWSGFAVGAASAVTVWAVWGYTWRVLEDWWHVRRAARVAQEILEDIES